MTSFEWYQFVELRQMQNSRVPYNIHDIISNPTYGLYFVDTTDFEAIYKTTDEGVTVSEVEDRAPITAITANWHDRTNNIVYFMEITAALVINVFSLDLSDDSIDELGSPDNTKTHRGFGDIFIYSGSIYVILERINAVPDPDEYSVEVYKYTAPGWNLEASQLIYADNAPALDFGVSYIVLDSDNVYFLVQDASNTEAEIWVYNITAKSFTKKEEIAGYVLPSARARRGLSYDNSDKLFFLLKQDGTANHYMYSYGITADLITQIGLMDVSIMLDRNCIGTSGTPWEFEKGFDISNPLVFQISRSRQHLFKIQNIGLTGGETIVAITDKYLFTSNADIYEYTNVILNCSIASCVYGVYIPPTIALSYRTSLSTDQLIEIYENASGTYTKCFSGRAGIPKYNSQTALYEFKCVNFGYDDLLRAVSKTVAAAGIDETVIALINDNCNYLYADATSVPNIAINITYTWEDQRLYDVLYTIAILANGYWWFEPNGYFYFRAYSNMPASGDTFSQATGDLGAPELRKLQNQFNTWIIDGGINSTTGKPFTKTETDDDHILLYGESVWNGREQFPEARTQADLDAIATGLKNWQGMQDNPDDAKSLVLGKYYYPVGYKASFQFTHLTEFATAQDMLISGVGINFKNKGMINVLFSTNITRGR